MQKMPTNHGIALLSSSEKKRLRDRKAQATLREKRQNRLQELESKVAFCEHNHGLHKATQPAYVRELLDTVERLRIENNRLRERQKCLREMVDSWGPTIDEHDNEGFNKSNRLPEVNDATPEQSHSITTTPTTSDMATAMIHMNTKTTPVAAATEAPFSGHILSSTYFPAMSPLTPDMCPVPHSVVNLPSSTEVLPPTAPIWRRVPLNGFSTNNTLIFPLQSAQNWFARPELIAADPEQPSPLDLLYGTRRNYLADFINTVVRRRAMRDVECLALGSLIYQWSKWRVSPTEANFARLAPFQHPSQTQLEVDHMAGLDMIIWPQIRNNMIKNWDKYDLIEWTDYVSCCMKVRWPWNKPMLERDADDQLQLRSDFREVFMNVDGWGLTAEFIDRYPELLEGMDVNALRFEITLPNEMYAY